MIRVLAIFACVALSTLAQVHSVEMTFTGANCVPCIESLPTRAKRIRGVENVTVDSAKGILSVTMANPNRVRVDQIRDLIQQDGTKPGEAKVDATGALELDEDGKTWLLRIPQSTYPIRLSGGDTRNWKAAKTVRIQGVIDEWKDQPFRMRVTEVKEP